MTKAPMRLLATGAVVAMAVTACSSSSSGGAAPTTSTSPNTSTSASASTANTASAPGVTATTVTIGSHQPLTGVAAPGYDEIAPASAAYFKYINASGGINGRTIVYKFLDDGYDPQRTVTDVHQLVEQDKVFGIFNGLGTPTHEAVVPFLNQQKVPDLFVASGCLCWNNVAKDPETFGWQTDYLREGKILGQYVAQHFKGQKIGIFAQNDDFGANGIKGLEQEIPSSSIVSTQRYDPTNIKIQPQVLALQQSGAQVVISFSVPAFTALLKLTALGLKFSPQLVVSNVGSDPITLSGLISSFSKGAAPGKALIQGIITDGYLSSPADPSNSWVKLFKKIHAKYMSPKIPFDGNVEYGMAAAYTFAEALKAAGQNPTRASIVAAVQSTTFTGPGLVPFGYSATSHSGFTGTQMGIIKGLAIKLLGTPLVTDDGNGAITPYTTPQPTAPANGIPPN
jgi:ABC-type branched-subunit amino acid transport system substrate-binding protein